MAELEDRLRMRAGRGVPRGAAPVLAAARTEAERGEAVSLGPDRTLGGRPGRSRIVAVATVAAVVAAVVGAALVLRSDDHAQRVSTAADSRFCDILGRKVLPAAATPLPDLVVFLDPKASPAVIGAVRRDLTADHRVLHVTYVDQAAALRRFRQIFKNQPELLRFTRAKGLPPSFELRLRRRSDIGAIRHAMESEDGVFMATPLTDVGRGRVLDLLVYPWFNPAGRSALESPGWRELILRRNNGWGDRLDGLRRAAPADLRHQVDAIVAGNLAILREGAQAVTTAPGLAGARRFADVVRSRCSLELDRSLTTAPPKVKAVRPTVPPD